MINILARLKSLGMEMEENFLVQFIINSVPCEYDPFLMNYNTFTREVGLTSDFKLNLETEHSISPFISLQVKTKKKKGIIR